MGSSQGQLGLEGRACFLRQPPSSAAHKLTCSAPRLLGSHGSHAGLGWGCCRNTPRHMHAHKHFTYAPSQPYCIVILSTLSTTTAQLAQIHYYSSSMTQLQLRDCRRIPSSAARCSRRRRWGSRLRWQSCKRGTARWAALCCHLLCCAAHFGEVGEAKGGRGDGAAGRAVPACVGHEGGWCSCRGLACAVQVPQVRVLAAIGTNAFIRSQQWHSCSLCLQPPRASSTPWPPAPGPASCAQFVHPNKTTLPNTLHPPHLHPQTPSM